jgi:hypothetical protein
VVSGHLRGARGHLWRAGLGLLAAGCTPSFDDRSSLVEAPRVLAIAASPAEVKPGEAVTFTALIAAPDGAAAADLGWALCTDRKPLAELGAVSPSCIRPSGPGLIDLGRGVSASGLSPKDSCRLFGPESPAPKPGEQAGRPVDPDPSGGYYLPVRALVGSYYATGVTRLLCGLSGATQETLLSFQKHYRLNQNPAVERLAVIVNGTAVEVPPVAAGAAPIRLPRGASVPVEVRWPVCPRTPACGDGVCSPEEDAAACPADCQHLAGCGGAETYLWFDREGSRIAVRREGMRASWFVTGGQLASDHTGAPEEGPDDRASVNTWVAPDQPGEARFWVVLRDDRGGVGWQSYAFTVE